MGSPNLIRIFSCLMSKDSVKNVVKAPDFQTASNVMMVTWSMVTAVAQTAKSNKDFSAQEAVIQLQTSAWMPVHWNSVFSTFMTSPIIS